MDTAPEDRRLRAEWVAAEAKIYPLVMVDARGYELAVSAVAAVVDLLRLEAHDFDALRRVATDPLGSVSRAGADPETFPGSITAEVIVAAACATRVREIEAQELAQRRVKVLAASRAAGQEWADVPAAGGPLERHGVPELRVHLASGASIHTAGTVDPQTADPTLLLMPVAVDLATGAMAAVTDIPPRTVACDQAAWAAAAADILRLLLDPGREPTS